ncbi:MAG TPA: DUF503 domain-containing protein [Acidimicrobiales bacterium]
MALYVLALAVDVRIPDAQSLKDKRSVVRSILDGAHRRFGASTSETGDADVHQRSELGFAVAASSVTQATEVVDAIERFVWSFPEIEVVACERHWMEVER